MFLKKADARQVFYLMGIVGALGGALTWTVSTIYLVTVVKLDPLQLVLVGTVTEAAVLLCEIPTGVVADTFSRKLSITIGLVIEGIAFIILALSHNVFDVMVFAAIFGAGYTFTSGATEAWVAGEVGEENVGQVFLRNSQFSQAAGLVGTVTSTIVGNFILTGPILVGGGLYLLAALYVAVKMPETGFKPTPRGERNSFQAMGHTLVEGLRSIRGRPVLVGLLVTNIFMGAYSEGYDRLWEAHFLKSIPFPGLNLSPVTWFGIMSIGGSIIYLVVVSLLRKRMNTTSANSTARWLIGLTIGQVIAIVVFGLTGNFWVALGAIWVKGLLGGLSDPLYTTWLTQNIEPQVRATVFSVTSQANAFGQIAGGPGVGAIGSAFSLRAAILTSAALLSPVIFLYRWTLKRSAPVVTVTES